MAESVDVVVIGLGPGGEEVAGRLAEAGLDVVGIDQRLVGGECPYYGCIPSKIMVRAADALAEARRIPEVAGSVEVSPDWSPVAGHVAEATADWDDQIAVDRLEGRGVRFVRGRGRMTGSKQVSVEDQVFDVRRAVVLNIGTEPAAPPIDGLAETPFWTNRDIVAVTEVPATLIVLGGGAIGCELAQVFARFGTTVTVVEVAPSLLASDEPESGTLMADVFEREGITVHADATVQQVDHDGNAFTLSLGEAGSVTAQRLLVSAGRRSALDDLGLEHASVDPDTRFLNIDDRCRVADGLWALGDATGKGAFTHASMYQAQVVVGSILGNNGPVADYRAMPRVTFTDPEVGAVGLTEAQAREQGLDVRTGFVELPSTSRGFIHGPGNDGFIKVVADAKRGILVGATAAGPSGGEVLGALAVAVHGEVPIDVLGQMIWAYPTFHRGIETALADLS